MTKNERFATRIRSIILISYLLAFTNGFSPADYLSCTKVSKMPLNMAQNRGLEQRRPGATPSEGGMTLYLKAAADGVSVGDCPFAHYIRLVLEEKNLDYQVQPTTSETKPEWLVEHYEGKLPALRHERECYVESSVVVEYLDFFFPKPSLQQNSMEDVDEMVSDFFPAVARYFKYTPDGDDADAELLSNVQEVLAELDQHLETTEYSYLTGDTISLADCRLVPQLYHFTVGVGAFKDNAVNMSTDYPKLHDYMQRLFERDSFVNTKYDPEVVVWGWTQARSS